MTPEEPHELPPDAPIDFLLAVGPSDEWFRAAYYMVRAAEASLRAERDEAAHQRAALLAEARANSPTQRVLVAAYVKCVEFFARLSGVDL